jgi:hypothetical protein
VCRLHLPGLTIARAGVVLVTGVVVGACNPAPSEPAEPAHDKRLTPRLIAQRIMYCDDGTRADVDFIDDGLKMAVTWLPKGRTEILRAQRTGDEFRGDQSRPSWRAGDRLHAARKDPRLSPNPGGIIGYAGTALHACACAGGRARRDHREPHQVETRLARLIHEPAALGRAGFDVSVAA